MEKAKEYFQKLIYIDEEIMTYFIMLSDIELKLGSESPSYQENYKWLVEAINRENVLFIEIKNLGLVDEIGLLAQNEVAVIPEPEIILRSGFGHLYRIKSLVEGLINDEASNYAHNLKYDINRILLRFLREMLNNPYYDSIKGSLISYKYGLLYLNIYNENDFVNNSGIDSINSLCPPDERRKRSIISGYLDEVLLEFPCLKNIDYLKEVSIEVFSDATLLNLVIKIINILARLVLSNERVVNKYCQELNSLLEDEECPEEIKQVYNELFQILQNIQTEVMGRK